MVWFFALTTVIFASVAVYLSFKGEGNGAKEKKLEGIKDDQMHVIVHELRAPITAIKGAASLLLSQNLPEEEKLKMLHAISDSAREMLARISELLDSAKLEEGKFTIKKVKSDLYVILREHVDVFSYAAADRGVELTLTPSAPIPHFSFDPGRIGQVVNNLISNSLKFTKTGGKIEIKIYHKKGEIEVEVADNGVGIPEDKRALLFTKFGQIGATQRVLPGGTGDVDGSGLGLFISRQIIEEHGGKIWIESQENVGTKVHFTLPLQL